MKLYDWLFYIVGNEMVDIIEKDSDSYKEYCIGKYSAKTHTAGEIFRENSDLLSMYVKNGGVSMHTGKAEEIVAEDSEMRDEFFEGDKEIPYVIVVVK